MVPHSHDNRHATSVMTDTAAVLLLLLTSILLFPINNTPLYTTRSASTTDVPFSVCVLFDTIRLSCDPFAFISPFFLGKQVRERLHLLAISRG